MPNMSRGIAIAVLFYAAIHSTSSEATEPIVSTLRVPNEGIQPQVVVGKYGTVHMVYY